MAPVPFCKYRHIARRGRYIAVHAECRIMNIANRFLDARGGWIDNRACRGVPGAPGCSGISSHPVASGDHMGRLNLTNAHKAMIAELYARTRSTVDDLPYTDEFDQLHAEFEARSSQQISKHDFWRVLSGCRKGSRLVRKER